jgi:hypothetical protein
VERGCLLAVSKVSLAEGLLESVLDAVLLLGDDISELFEEERN